MRALSFTLLLTIPLLPTLACDDDDVVAIRAEGEGEVEAGEGEGEAGEGEGEGEGEPEACTPADLTDAGDPDKTRVVLVSHGFTEEPGVDGTDIRSLTLTGTALVDDGERLDVGTRVSRIVFVPSGELALVLGEDGLLVSVRVLAAKGLEIVDTLQLRDTADYNDIRLSSDAQTAWISGKNVTTEDGVHVVTIGCDGALTEEPARFFGLRLAETMAIVRDDRAVLLGGQAVFEPIDDDDTRILSLTGPVTEVGAFDFWSDSVNATRIGASPDGTMVAVGNDALFGDVATDILLLGVAGDVVSALDRVTGYGNAAESMFSADGETLLVSQWEADRVVTFDVRTRTLVEGSIVTGIGLAEQMDQIGRGATAGLVVVAAVNAVGNVHLLRVTGAGQAEDLGKVDLGDGSGDIPFAIAVQP